MKAFSKGDNIHSVADNSNIKNFPVDQATERHYYVTTDTNGNIKGYFPIKEKNLGKDWLALYQHPALWLAKQHLTGEQFKVMFYLFSQLDFDNYLRVSQSEIADETNIHPVNVSKAIKVLKEKCIIVEGPPAGKFKTYRLNPYIAMKGKDRDNNIIDFESALEHQGKDFRFASDFSDDSN